ncbi:hypothetical protein AYI68_g5343 [Smittium mucronatum]|uniref:Rhodanese domain-containing protein n=1 Tax=Smittium mucronatum TaxID=133383 RepID=A0A1R0GUM7_9FUNG|nr:hypothetical protein AYI68_g5343 [Smittium mucronatum]
MKIYSVDEYVAGLKENCLPQVFIDFRSEHEYQQLHFKNSINTVPEHLFERLYEFPPKTESLAIVVSQLEFQSDKSLIIDFQAKLLGKGYSVSAGIVWHKNSCDFQQLDKISIFETGNVYYNVFFPNPSLKAHLDLIETLLLNRYVSSNSFGSCYTDLQCDSLIPSKTQGSEGLTKNLNILDLGCGCGRDLVYMASRKIFHPIDGAEVRWRCIGLDSLDYCLLKARILALRSGFSDQIELYHAKISANSDHFLPVKNNRNLTQSNIFKFYVSCFPQYSEIDPAVQFYFKSIDSLPKQYHLITSIRFVDRGILDSIDNLLYDGGVVFISTFVQGPNIPHFDKPAPEHCLKPNELLDLFLNKKYKIISNAIEKIEDGRSVNTFIAQKPWP